MKKENLYTVPLNENLINYSVFKMINNGTTIVESTNSEIIVENSYNYRIKTVLNVSKLISFLKKRNRKNAYLYLTPTSDDVKFTCRELLYKQTKDNLYLFDLSPYLTSSHASATITLEAYEGDDYSPSEFFGLNTENPPYCVFEYLVGKEYSPSAISLSSPLGTNAKLIIPEGKLIAAFEDTAPAASPLGVSVSHVYNPDEANPAYGEGFRLNLEEKLEKKDALLNSLSDEEKERLSVFDYIYTDGEGTHHGFKEYFYYTVNGKKTYVTANDVTVNTFGELSYTFEGNEYSITRSLRSDLGWEVQADLNGIQKIKLFEQRSEDRTNLEEQKREYENALKEYVVINSETGAELKEKKPSLTYESVEIALKENEMLLPFDAALSFASSLLQQESIESQQSAPEEEADSITQKDLLDAQVKKMRSSKEQCKESFKNQLLTYLRMKEQLEMLRKTEPTSYMIKDSTVKGFNDAGELCCVFDSSENYVAIDRNTEGLITRIYDNDKNEIVLVYDSGKLISLTDVNGNRVTYSYEGKNLTQASFSSGKNLDFSYTAKKRLFRISSSASSVHTTASDFKNITFEETDNKLSKATFSSSASLISATDTDDTATELSSVLIQYGEDRVTFTDTDGKCELYKFGEDGKLAEYYREENGAVTDAVHYIYTYTDISTENNKHLYTVTEKSVLHADVATLFQTPLASYSFEGDKQVVTTIDPFFQLQKEVTSENVSDSKQHCLETEYFYDASGKLASKTAKEYDKTAGMSASNLRTTSTSYFYNSLGKLLRAESYEEGKENTLGKSIEESVYDDRGNVVKSFTYNSLDPSSKFYTESEIDENGRTTADVDATGRSKTFYSYFANGNLASETYPNGGSLSYSYDLDGNVNAITQSTADGEANTNTTLYTAGEVTKLVSGNNTVDYTYDGKRRLTNVKLNGQNHVSYSYTEGETEDTVTTTYEGGYTVTKTEDKFGRVTKLSEGYTTLANLTYTPDGRILTKGNCSYQYDNLKRLTSYSGSINEQMTYDTKDRLSTESQVWHSIAYSYDDADRVSSLSVTNNSYDNFTVSPAYDAIGRSAGKSVSLDNAKIMQESVSYLKHGDHATNLPQSVRYAYGSGGTFGWKDSVSYTYDCMGNISSVYENDELVCRYEYDSLNRLIREDNKAFGKTVLFAYDENGNITSKRHYAYTVTKTTAELEESTYTKKDIYRYDGDKLKAYNNYTFAYDAMGNPTSYKGKSLTWSRARLLTAYGDKTFSYDAFGNCTDLNWLAIKYGKDGKIMELGDGLAFIYDHTGLVSIYDLSCMSEHLTVYVQKDALGNIRALLDKNGNIVVQYKYDAYGNHKVLDASGNEIPEDYQSEYGFKHIGHRNPFRYRGYFYDVNTGLYYLESRFYDPETGRFLNADTVEYLDPESINGLNLYAYCGNNPVMNVDPTGHFPWLVFAIISACITISCATVGGISAGMSGGTAGDVFAGIGKGTVNGLAFSAGILLTALGFYYGITTIIGSALGFYGMSMAANLLEVAVIQGKKSYFDGDDAWNTIHDINRSVFANTGAIAWGESNFFSAISIDGTRIISKAFTGGKAFYSYAAEALTKHYNVPFVATMKNLLFKKANPVFCFIGAGTALFQVGKLLEAIFTTPNFEESNWILY